MPARKALPVQLSSEHERELNELVAGAFNATEVGGTGSDHLTGRDRPGDR